MNISVIIPLYNAERFIAKALDSCLQFPEVKEIIVVDDAYPDKAMGIVQEYAAKYTAVKYYHHPNNENRGAGASRNLGIVKATGDFIAFLDADDFFLPNRFDAEKVLFKSEKVDGVYGGLGVHYYSAEARRNFNLKFPASRDGDFLTTLSEPVRPEELFGTLWGDNDKVTGYFSLDTFTIRTNILKQQPYFFRENLRLHQDTEFLYRLAYHCNLHAGILNKAVAMRGVHEENRITNIPDEKRIDKNRYLMYNEVYRWAVENKLENQYVENFIYKKYYFQLKSGNQFQRIIIYLELLWGQDSFLLSDNPSVTRLHLELFKNRFLKKIHMKTLYVLKKIFASSNRNL